MKKRSTKGALLISGLLLLASLSMFVGSTYAWYIDSASSKGNIIQAGKLDLTLGQYDDRYGQYVAVQENSDPIFDDYEWSPGDADVKLLMLMNNGSLNADWSARFVSTASLSALADVIDVFIKVDTSPIDRDFPLDLTTYVGTLKSFVNTAEDRLSGNLKCDKTVYIGIALKMRDNASMEYHDMELNGTFDIQFVATQENTPSGASTNLNEYRK